MGRSCGGLDGLPVRESGSWIQQKHHPLTYYSEIFNQAMKDQVWLHHRLYLELFAGPGKCLIRESNQEDLGSPLKVLEKNFTDFIFVEINEAAARVFLRGLGDTKRQARLTFGVAIVRRQFGKSLFLMSRLR